MQLEASERIDRPAATVFDFIGFHHVANHHRWDPEVQLQQLTKGPIGVGTVIRRRSTHYGEAIDDVMECVEFDPPSAIGLLVRGGPVEIHARMSVQADGPHRSLLTIGVDLPSADIPMDPRLLEETTQRIKDLIESDR